MRRYLPFVLISLVFVIGYLFFSHNRAKEDDYEGDKPAPHANELTASQEPGISRTKPPRPASFPKTITLLPSAAEADLLHSTDTSPEEDLSLIQSFLRSHRGALGANPVGLNDEITAALTGNNARGAASLPGNHPAISAQGELLDRWGTPYRFHAYSGKLMEVSSAGPDRKFFTSDDVKLTE